MREAWKAIRKPSLPLSDNVSQIVTPGEPMVFDNKANYVVTPAKG
jgi:hypothetical protein